ncbi:hypothetical protein EDF66_104227 [Sphingobacterium sp. JUb20]|nr:hypothetical protein [Sphingobacterium sp. JUb21]TCR08122.1 hypothetical protein EDF66_104227 [Sphingobacterium sp. JUb20]
MVVLVIYSKRFLMDGISKYTNLTEYIGVLNFTQSSFEAVIA